MTNHSLDPTTTKRIPTPDGTWGDRNSPNKPVILDDSLVELVRAPGRSVEKYLGGGLDKGVESYLIEDIDSLVTNYSESDEPHHASYSQGSYAARMQSFLDETPRDGNTFLMVADLDLNGQHTLKMKKRMKEKIKKTLRPFKK